MIRTACVLFDFGGTLDAEGVPWKTRFSLLAAEAGVRVPAAEFDRAFYAADDALVGAVPATLGFRETVQRLARGLACALGVSRAMPADAIADRFLDAARAQISRNALLLEALARRYRLGIVSNFYGNLDTVCGDVGLRPLFGAIVDSARAGVMKPDARIFRLALERLAVEPSHAVFVGDSVRRDMRGAGALGMRHIWLKGDADSGTPCCAGDPVLRTLGDLRGMLL